jgi:hypothetical protein
MYKRQREFIQLAYEVDRICDSMASWETKYDMVFSDEVSNRMHELVTFDYYDPDTTYEEDVRAFRNAVMEKARELEIVIGDAA